MSQILIESKCGSLSMIKESAENKNSGILGRLRGPCAECDVPTRNGRRYSRKLWESVINSPTFKEYMDSKMLFGELNHPTDRIETDITKVAIALSDIELKPDGTLYGTFDILNTPSGKILKALCDYGSKPGVSSRGGGDIIMREGVEYVDEDTYDFVGFDVVTLPAVKKARPTVVESVQAKKKRETLQEQLRDVIDNETSISNITTIKGILEKLNVPNLESTLEYADKKLKELEGKTLSESVTTDLTEALAKIDILEKENGTLKQQLSAASVREKKLKESLSRLPNPKTQVIGNPQQLAETLSAKLKRSIDTSTTLRKENSELRTRNTQLVRENQELRTRGGSSEESLRRVTESRTNLEAQLVDRDAKITELQEQLKLERAKNAKLVASIPKRVQEEVAKSTKDSTIRIQQLMEQCSSLEARCKQSNSRCKETQKRLDEAIKKYISMRCQSMGISESDIYNKLGKNVLLENVDKELDSLIDLQQRLGSLPFDLGSNERLSARLISEDAKPIRRDNGVTLDEDLSGLQQLTKARKHQ